MKIIDKKYVIDQEEGFLTVYLKKHKDTSEAAAKKRAFKALRLHGIPFTGMGSVIDVGSKYRFPPLYANFDCIIYTEEVKVLDDALREALNQNDDSKNHF